jgi:hypothetical protein
VRPAGAERLPLRPYTVADGLAHNVVNKILRDRRGLIWFGTDDGLSRFDGYAFTTFGVEQGLPHPTGFILNGVDITADGKRDGSPDSDGWTLLTPDVAGRLKAELGPGGSVRVYTLTYEGRDAAGNRTRVSKDVRVSP